MQNNSKEILELLSKANSIMTVKEISKQLFISEPTVRRKLAQLEQEDLVIRTHGAALINYASLKKQNAPLYFRLANVSTEKNKIAQQASELVQDGAMIFLDASSTAFHIIPYLKQFNNLTICTNSIKTAAALAEMNLHVVCFGGDVNNSNMSCNNFETMDYIQKYNADILFFSCDALSADGVLTDNNKDACYIRSKLLQQSATSVLLIDNTKLDKKCSNRLCSLSDIDYVFCNEPLPQPLISMLKSDKNK